MIGFTCCMHDCQPDNAIATIPNKIKWKMMRHADPRTWFSRGNHVATLSGEDTLPLHTNCVKWIYQWFRLLRLYIMEKMLILEVKKYRKVHYWPADNAIYNIQLFLKFVATLLRTSDLKARFNKVRERWFCLILVIGLSGKSSGSRNNPSIDWVAPASIQNFL